MAGQPAEASNLAQPAIHRRRGHSRACRVEPAPSTRDRSPRCLRHKAQPSACTVIRPRCPPRHGERGADRPARTARPRHRTARTQRLPPRAVRPIGRDGQWRPEPAVSSPWSIPGSALERRPGKQLAVPSALLGYPVASSVLVVAADQSLHGPSVVGRWSPGARRSLPYMALTEGAWVQPSACLPDNEVVTGEVTKTTLRKGARLEAASRCAETP